uniref:Uncharacterized protein n=1 Tax=viral metagenome TaxID=1070528 RepID=A0A6C0JR07_9ZZZZ
MTITLLPPTIDTQIIKREQYATLLPAYFVSHVENYDQVYKVTITPHKTASSGITRVSIVAAANMRTSGLFLENGGRVPTTAPPHDQDDLRPIIHYYYGTGTQQLQIKVVNDHTNWLDFSLTF